MSAPAILERLRGQFHAVRVHQDDPALRPALERAEREARERAAAPGPLPQFLPPREYRRFVGGREVAPAVARTPTLAILELAAERRAAGDCDGTRLEVWDGGALGDSETLGWLARRFPSRVIR